ncbi:hypothetical protein Ct61P_10312 [Colletotrichum tofieldiae]|nr:hypothetical protein Ct61P_10312 [Colletotrichum tofieldiae]
MNPTTIQPLTRTSLEKFDQVAARANTPPHPGQTASLKEVKKAVYALAWQLSRIGEAGHRILDAEEIAVIGPDEVQSVPTET